MLWVVNPSGVVNTVFTVTGTSTAGFTSTTQVKVTLDPKGGIGLGMLLDNFTEVGAGTAELHMIGPAKHQLFLEYILSK